MDVRCDEREGRTTDQENMEASVPLLLPTQLFFSLLPIADRSCLICQFTERLSVEQRGGYLPSAVRLSVNDVIWVAFASRNDTSAPDIRTDQTQSHSPCSFSTLYTEAWPRNNALAERNVARLQM
ncbi:hypothetical protein CBL_05405 [Carabus blaptoides fortunei]